MFQLQVGWRGWICCTRYSDKSPHPIGTYHFDLSVRPLLHFQTGISELPFAQMRDMLHHIKSSNICNILNIDQLSTIGLGLGMFTTYCALYCLFPSASMTL